MVLEASHKINPPRNKTTEMRYTNKRQKKAAYTAGKFYHIDTIEEDLPGTVICNMFRKPIKGEKTPDGILHQTERNAELSDYSLCTASFSITVSILFNSADLNRPGDPG